MTEYIRVSAEEADDDVIEFPTEEDGTLLLSTLVAQFRGASGLNFRTETGTIRAVKTTVDNKLHPPNGGWGNRTYLCAYPRADTGLQSFLRGGNISTSTQFSNQSFQGKLRSKLESNNCSSGDSTCVSNSAAPNNGALDSTQSFLARIKLNLESKNSGSSHSSLEKISTRNEPASSSSSSRFAFNSTLKNLSVLSKDSNGSADLNSDIEMERISGLILKMEKMYRKSQKLKLIDKALEELVLENPTSLPENIVKVCETNILKGKLGYFDNPEEACDHKVFISLFKDPSESLNTKDSKILETKLFEFTSRKCKEKLAKIEKVNAQVELTNDHHSESSGFIFRFLLGLEMYVKEPSVKPGSILTDQQQHIISSSNKIKSTHDQNKRMASEIVDLLEILGNYRSVTLPNLNLQITASLKIKTMSLESDIRSFSKKIMTAMLKNDESLPEAVDQLLILYQKEVESCVYALSKLQKLREEYQAIIGPTFDKLVLEYKTLKQINDNKEEMLQVVLPENTLGDISYLVSDED